MHRLPPRRPLPQDRCHQASVGTARTPGAQGIAPSQRTPTDHTDDTDCIAPSQGCPQIAQIDADSIALQRKGAKAQRRFRSEHPKQQWWRSDRHRLRRDHRVRYFVMSLCLRVLVVVTLRWRCVSSSSSAMCDVICVYLRYLRYLRAMVRWVNNVMLRGTCAALASLRIHCARQPSSPLINGRWRGGRAGRPG